MIKGGYHERNERKRRKCKGNAKVKERVKESSALAYIFLQIYAIFCCNSQYLDVQLIYSKQNAC